MRTIASGEAKQGASELLLVYQQSMVEAATQLEVLRASLYFHEADPEVKSAE